MEGLRHTLRDAAKVVGLAALLGLAYNGISPHGIPLIRSEHYSLPTAAIKPVVINATEARQVFEQGKALFLDARHEADYLLGHIQGARSLPLDTLERRPDVVSSIPKETLIVTYCGGEDCASSSDLAYKLAALGYTNVRIFFAGWNEWLQQNLPIEVGPPQR